MAGKSEQRVDLPYITVLRGAASLLVVYDHLIASWLDSHSMTWRPADAVTDHVEKPLGIIQHWGFFGVGLFFLLSGFIITHVARGERQREFLVKRVFRIYPPLIVSMLLIWISGPIIRHLFRYDPAIGLAGGPFSFGDLVSASALRNYFTASGTLVNGVAWTLAIEVSFYALVWLLMPLLKRSLSLQVLALLGFVAVCIVESRDHGPDFFQTTAVLAYLPVLALGQVLYGIRFKLVGPWMGTLLALLCWFTFDLGLHRIHSAFLAPGNLYGPSLLLAIGVLVICMLAWPAKPAPAPTRFFSDISYSLYLNHGLVGQVVLSALVIEHGMRFIVAMPLAVAASILVAWLSVVLIERPGQRAARRILRWSKPTAKAPTAALGGSDAARLS